MNLNRRSRLEILVLSGLMLMGVVAFTRSSNEAIAGMTFVETLSPISLMRPVNLAQLPETMTTRPPRSGPQDQKKK